MSTKTDPAGAEAAVERSAGDADAGAEAAAADAGGSPEPDRLDEIAVRIDQLADLFVRRLSDDRARRAAVEELSERLRRAEQGQFREYLHPFVHGLALVIDRLDRYDGPDPEFAESIRAELGDLLERHGVQEIPASGAFDPARHEAVGVRHDPDADPDAVLEVRRTGFAHGSWVFRPTQVVVNAEQPPE